MALVLVDFGQHTANLNDTTYVSAIPAPSSGTTRVARCIRVYNADDIAHVIYIAIYDGTSTWVIAVSGTVAAGQVFEFGTLQEVAFLQSTTAITQQIQVKCGEAHHTTQPTCYAAWGDYS